MSNVSKSIGGVIGGLILMVIGYALSTVLLGSAATSGSSTNAPSFSGFQGISDLGPIVFISAVILAGVGLIGAAGAGFVGRGPLGVSIVPVVSVGIGSLVGAAALPVAPVVMVVLSAAVTYGAYAHASRSVRHMEEPAELAEPLV